MSNTRNITRLSPVKVRTSQPSYCVSNESSYETFSNHMSGFGNRHRHDDAPFTLWNDEENTFRDPTREELLWIRRRFVAISIDLAFPHMCIRTLDPPNPIPCTVAAVLVRFAPPDVNIELTPTVNFYPYGDKDRDVLTSKLPTFSFPDPEVCVTIIRKLALEVKMRAIHFLPPLIIVEVAGNKVYERYSLPGRAGEITIVYHVSATPYWSGNMQLSYSRLLEPSDLVPDNSDYLYADPKILSPGVCLASASLDSASLLTSTWRTTTAGIMLQRGYDRLITVANDGFRHSEEVYHSTPLGRRVGQIVERLPEIDIALLSLDPSISFSNARYFQAPAPLRMIPHEQIKIGDNFELDGISTGRLDLVAVGKSYYFEAPIPPKID